MYYWLFLIPVFFFALALIGTVMQAKGEKRRKEFNEYYKVDEKAGRALDSSSRKHVKETIDELQDTYRRTEQSLPSASRSLYSTDMSDLKAHLKELEEEAWLKKAEKYLITFAENDELVTSGELNNFKDVELAMAAKKKCISSWQKYFAVDYSG